MKIDSNTKINDILKAYPKLNVYVDEIRKQYPILNSLPGKMFLKSATIADLAQRSGYSEEDIIREIKNRL